MLPEDFFIVFVFIYYLVNDNLSISTDRPTEIPEEDVYVCESLYDEARRQIKKLENLKKISRNHPLAHQDEIYYFRRPVTLTKVDLDGTPIPEMPKLKAATKIEAVSVTFCQKLTKLTLRFLR